jgi:hypothetical protein
MNKERTLIYTEYLRNKCVIEIANLRRNEKILYYYSKKIAESHAWAVKLVKNGGDFEAVEVEQTFNII